MVLHSNRSRVVGVYINYLYNMYNTLLQPYDTIILFFYILQRPLGKTNSNLYVAVPSAPTDNEYVIQSCKPITKAIVRERFKHPRITELLEVRAVCSKFKRNVTPCIQDDCRQFYLFCECSPYKNHNEHSQIK